jgi:hypothetical protein
MRHRSLTSFLVAGCGLFALSSFGCGGSEGDSCGQLQSYTPSTTTTLSYATDIHPILSNATFAVGCSQTEICHGAPAMALDPAMTKTFSLIDPPATVKTTLLQQPPVNAPGMKFVVPSNVGASLLAYKISPANVLACVNSMCVSGASVGASMPCGDPMPIGGMLTAADRTKILDWIAQGAAD